LSQASKLISQTPQCPETLEFGIGMAIKNFNKILKEFGGKYVDRVLWIKAGTFEIKHVFSKEKFFVMYLG
jgi:hypothetical protein